MLLEPEVEMVGEDDKRTDSTATVQMQVDVAVLKSQVSGIDKKLDSLMQTLNSNFASKVELASLNEDVKALKSNQGWIIKIIVGAVIVAVLGLVIVKGGNPR